MHFCDKTLTGCSSSRALAHILGRPVLDQSKANVRFCVPIRKEDDDGYEQFKTAQKVLNKQVMTKEAQLSSSKSRQTVLDLTSLGKRTVTGEMKTVESKTLDSAIANVFYENALPFNVADSPSLAHMVEKCIEFGQQHPGRKYKAPNRKRIGGALLDTAYEDTAASVQPIVDRAKKYGATLTSDGWSDVQRRPITNFMLVTRESALFMKSIDSTDRMAEGGKKNAAYLADQINSVIKEVGGELIVQVIMDGANRACWHIINAAFPHIICAWCTAHVMDLLLEDIGKMYFTLGRVGLGFRASGRRVGVALRGHV